MMIPEKQELVRLLNLYQTELLMDNHSGMDYTVRRGDKISQLVVVNVDTPDLVLVDKLADTERGNGGFGSTGR